MGKKVREYKSGDFIFAKVKGYPAWPARVQRLNGKKYFVYFYGTGETANLPPNMIFDYAENKDKFLTKTVKRRDFNDGVKQIEHDFANNVPLEQVIGITVEVPPADASANDTVNESTSNDTMDETMADTTAADETMAEDTTLNATQNDTAVDDSDDTGNLVIDEGKQKQTKKNKVEVKPKEKETPAKPAKEPKTPRGKAKKEEAKDAAKDEDDEKKEEEIVSRSGRKIRPKRYMDEQTEDNTTLPSPAPKKRRGASPEKEKPVDKNIKHFNAVPQSELEDLKEPFKSDDTEKENILIAYLPSGQYIGIKLFQSRPSSFKNEAARLQWDKQAAAHAVTLKIQLEKGHITQQSVLTQLVTDLNLTDEEKATLDKERETEEKRSRVQFLKTEMKLIELDAKIKTCLCLEKADTEMCLKLLDELMELDVKPLMLLKHPTCLETIKRMRAYVGNTPSWELSESAALVFSKQAHRIRKQADTTYKNMKELFTTPEGLSFWEFFTERVLQFKKVTSKLSADELLEMIHEPLEMTIPTAHTAKAVIEAANKVDLNEPEEEEATQKKKSTSAKSKKGANNISAKTPIKRQSSRKQNQEDKEKEKESSPKPDEITEQADTSQISEETTEKGDEITEKLAENSEELTKDAESSPGENKVGGEQNGENENNEDEKSTHNDVGKEEKTKEKAEKTKDKEEKTKAKEDRLKEKEEKAKEREEKAKEKEEKAKEKEEKAKEKEEKAKEKEEKAKEKEEKVKEREEKVKDREDKSKDKEEKTKDKEDEPRAKRSRENKKTEPPPQRSPAKRKSKF